MGVTGVYKILEGSPLEDKGKTASVSGAACINGVCFKDKEGKGFSCTVVCGPSCCMISPSLCPILVFKQKDEDTLESTVA